MIMSLRRTQNRAMRLASIAYAHKPTLQGRSVVKSRAKGSGRTDLVVTQPIKHDVNMETLFPERKL